jgi:Carboxypeptidase regulatory-like domain
VIRISARPGIAVLFALSCLASCAKGTPSKRDAGKHAGSTSERRDSAAGSVDVGATSYRAGALSAVGSVAGVVKLDGEIPADTAPTASGQPACDVAVEPVGAAGGDRSNTVVWIADAKTGKALPIDRRVEISTEHCVIDPRIQTAVVGSGINIFNDDRLLHKLIFTRSGTDDTVAVMPFFNDGQLVASTALAAKPGVIEIRCAQHGWMHGYILVFDHPYFAVTSGDGTFKIDSLAPGTYKLMVWHEGAAKPLEKTIKVTAGGTARADVSLVLDAGK